MSDLFPSSSSAGLRTAVRVDAGLRAHMQSIYQRMTLGLLITFVTAFIASQAATVMSALMNPVIALPLALAPLAVVWFGFNPRTMSSAKLKGSFVLLSVLYGLSFAIIFAVYVPADIVRALLMTTIMFAGLSIFGYTTQRDLGPVGVFAVMGMFGLLAFSLVSMGASLLGYGFMPAGGTLDLIVSVAALVIFAALTAWETQLAKETYNPGYGSEGNSRMAWMSALNLYINFIAIFQYLLHLIGNRE